MGAWVVVVVVVAVVVCVSRAVCVWVGGEGWGVGGGEGGGWKCWGERTEKWVVKGEVVGGGEWRRWRRRGNTRRCVYCGTVVDVYGVLTLSRKRRHLTG